ncbi:MAG: aldo/keto reductase [Planctomycetaceae bacterium]|nr:aldo/keto reductase [Planctomycetaceae bacterium]
MPFRKLGKTDIEVTPVSMGCWPITGITSINVTREQSLATLQASFDTGINFYDTAYCYGYEGESERMISEVLGSHREDIVLATKCGIHWKNKVQQRDARPETIKQECEESLRRLGTDRIDLYYLHAPDPSTPIADSAGAIGELIQQGKVLTAGASNFDVAQLNAFHSACPLTAYQPHYNMLQREIEDAQLPWCIENDVSVCVYWPLMKGLLAGQLARGHQFEDKDGRKKYPMFQGEEFQKNQDFIDVLRGIADDVDRPVAQVVINWTMQRNGITAALCGAKRPEQIVENAESMQWTLTESQVAIIDQAIQDRGPIVSRGAV